MDGHDETGRGAGPQADYPWLAPAQASDDRLADTVAVVALALAIGIGLVIAMLPVSVRATSVELAQPAEAAVAVNAPAR